MNILYFLIPVLFIAGTSFIAVKAVKKGANKKHAVIAQIASVACAMVVCTAMPAITNVSAETSDKATVSTSENASNDGASAKASAFGWGLIAAAIVTGLSGIGGGIAVASAAPAAIAATSEDPKAFGKALIFVVLGEGIAIYGLLISIMIFSKIDQLGV